MASRWRSRIHVLLRLLRPPWLRRGQMALRRRRLLRLRCRRWRRLRRRSQPRRRRGPKAARASAFRPKADPSVQRLQRRAPPLASPGRSVSLLRAVPPRTRPRHVHDVSPVGAPRAASSAADRPCRLHRLLHPCRLLRPCRLLSLDRLLRPRTPRRRRLPGRSQPRQRDVCLCSHAPAGRLRRALLAERQRHRALVRLAAGRGRGVNSVRSHLEL